MQVNRSMTVLRKILSGKQKILAMGCQYVCGQYVQKTYLFDESEVVTNFNHEYVESFGRYAEVQRMWRRGVIVRSSWWGLRQVLYSYFDWNCRTYYPYYYSLYWTSNNGMFFNGAWFNNHVFSYYSPLISFENSREPILELGQQVKSV